ncbi:transcription factor bHLH118 [Ziziphus jujuba]|uniref:Transcription factor bHLH118 n=1 Tax=Ziziphus jujuba TaxID=326968 RepID=A0A6P3ZH81_ZIZJJ|nr:transcription factor bHLH118 [Ziziphus jujuba]
MLLKLTMSGSDNRRNSSENDKKKMMHRDSERQRRQQMALLNASLRSQLPSESIKGKRSVSDHINEAVNHINNMKNKIEQLTVKKDKLESSSNISTSSPKSESSSEKQCLANSIVIRPFWGGIEIVISSGGLRGKDLPLSCVLEVLVLEEGLNVVRCASTRANGTLIHTVQAEVDDINRIDLSELQQKLSMCCPD